MAESLKNKTIKGVGWSAIDNISKHLVTFTVGIVLARILSPDDYGLLGLIGIFTAVCDTLINAGFYSALIRKKDTTEDDYNTVFIVNMTMSVFLYAVICVCASLIADFFGRDELITLVRVSSLGLIINGFCIVQRCRLTKRIDFKSQTKITITASVASGIIGIVMALLGAGVWALVGQNMSSNIIRAAMLWHVNKWAPSLRFSKSSFHELFGYGWKMMVSGILDTVWKELYQLIVGKFYSPATLGQYTRAKHYSQLLSKNVTSIVQRVTFPVLSSIQDDKQRMVSAYRRMIKTTMFVTSISCFFLGAISEPLIHCMIGAKWHEAAVYLPLICINGSTYPLHAINLNMLQVQGRSDLFLGLEVIKKTIAVGPLLIGAFVGIIPMLLASIVTNIIAYFLNSYYSGKLLGYSSWMQLKDIAPAYGVAALIVASVFFLKYLPLSYWIILPIQIITGILVFFLICRCTKVEGYNEMKNIISPVFNKLRRK